MLAVRVEESYVRRRGDAMHRTANWFIVATGCLLILLSVGARWFERVKIRGGANPDRDRRFYWAWLPLFLGLGGILGKLPTLLGAPSATVVICDSLNALLAVTTPVLAIRARVRIPPPGDAEKGRRLWLPAEARAEALQFIHTDERMRAVRVIRDATGFALQPAVDVMEALKAGIPVPERRPQASDVTPGQ